MITSTKNPNIKEVLNLQVKSKQRKQTGLFVFEGEKELELILKSSYKIEKVFVYQALISEETQNLLNNTDALKILINRIVFEKIAYRSSTGGIVVVAKAKTHTVKEFNKKENGLYLVLEDVEKPGNLGAVLRTADAANVDGVFICNPKTDVYNPNVIRSSLGCLFTTPLYVSENNEVIELFKKHEIQIYSTYLHEGTINLFEANLKESCGLVLGTEATGISQIWVDEATACIKIPMLGQIDSLNVSNAAAIVTYEALRQKKYTKK